MSFVVVLIGGLFGLAGLYLMLSPLLAHEFNAPAVGIGMILMVVACVLIFGGMGLEIAHESPGQPVLDFGVPCWGVLCKNPQP